MLVGEAGGGHGGGRLCDEHDGAGEGGAIVSPCLPSSLSLCDNGQFSSRGPRLPYLKLPPPFPLLKAILIFSGLQLVLNMLPNLESIW